MNSENIQLHMKISDIWRRLVANHQEDRRNSSREGFIFLMGYSGPNYRQFLRSVQTRAVKFSYTWGLLLKDHSVKFLSTSQSVREVDGPGTDKSQ